MQQINIKKTKSWQWKKNKSGIDLVYKHKPSGLMFSNCGKFLNRWKYQTTLPAPEKSVCRSRSNRTGHGTMGWFQIVKGVRQGCTLSSCLFNLYAEYIMQNARLDDHKLELRFPGEISITQICR